MKKINLKILKINKVFNKTKKLKNLNMRIKKSNKLDKKARIILLQIYKAAKSQKLA